MKKKLLFVPLIGMLLAGCSFEDLMFWKKKDADTDQKGGDEGGGDSGGETGAKTTKTINLYGSYLPEEWTNTGVVMNSKLLSCKTQNERMVNTVKNQVNNTSFMSEIFFTALNTAWYDSNNLIVQVGTGNPAKDSFESGTFIWTSTKKIYKVEVTGQCYVKTQGATDSNAHMTIEAGEVGVPDPEDEYARPIANGTTEDMSFVVGSGETPEYKTFTNEYDEGINRFCLTSLGGRMLLKSLTITWGS